MIATFKHYNEVAHALRKLGYTESSINDLQIADIDMGRAEICLNLRPEKIGIWDFSKHTFVD